MIRTAKSDDAAALELRGIKVAAESIALVNERNGAIDAAISLVPRAFETELLEIRTFHIEALLSWGGEDVLEALIAAALEAATKVNVRLVGCRRPDTDRSTLFALQNAGFQVIECLVTLGRTLSTIKGSNHLDVRLAQAGDAPHLAAIAGRSFCFDRFHADPRVPDAAADRLKAAWARNAVLGRADAVFVTEEQGRITGFNACTRRNDIAVIDLIAVDPDKQGRGIGRKLVDAALAHYANGALRMLVGTQSSNRASLDLYQSAGFRVESSALTLHAHIR